MSNRCDFPGCLRTALPGSRNCIVHIAVKAFDNRAKQAERKGDTLAAVLNSVGAKVFSSEDVQTAVDRAMLNLRQFGNNAVQDPRAAAQQAKARVDQFRQKPTTTCFDVLGIDPMQATKQDVERIRKHLARLYHGDTSTTGIKAEQMAKINAAADEALRYIDARDSGRTTATG